MPAIADSKKIVVGLVRIPTPWNPRSPLRGSMADCCVALGGRDVSTHRDDSSRREFFPDISIRLGSGTDCCVASTGHRALYSNVDFETRRLFFPIPIQSAVAFIDFCIAYADPRSRYSHVDDFRGRDPRSVDDYREMEPRSGWSPDTTNHAQ